MFRSKSGCLGLCFCLYPDVELGGEEALGSLPPLVVELLSAKKQRIPLTPRMTLLTEDAGKISETVDSLICHTSRVCRSLCSLVVRISEPMQDFCRAEVGYH